MSLYTYFSLSASYGTVLIDPRSFVPHTINRSVVLMMDSRSASCSYSVRSGVSRDIFDQVSSRQKIRKRFAKYALSLFPR